MSLDLELSSKTFLLLPDVSAMICASCHVTLLSVPNQMTCTCSCCSWPTSRRQHSRHEILVSWLTPLAQATLSAYRLTCLQYLISPPKCIAWHILPQTVSLRHILSFQVLISACLAFSLILDGLNLWPKHTHTQTAKLCWPFLIYVHINLCTSSLLSLMTLTYSYQTPAPTSGILEFSQYCNNTLCAKGTRNSSRKSHRDLGTCLLCSLADGKIWLQKRVITKFWGMNEAGFLRSMQSASLFMTNQFPYVLGQNLLLSV